MKLFDTIIVRKWRENLLLAIGKYSMLGLIFYIFKYNIWDVAKLVASHVCPLVYNFGVITVEKDIFYIILSHVLFFAATYVISYTLFVFFTLQVFVVSVKLIVTRKKRYYILLALLVAILTLFVISYQLPALNIRADILASNKILATLVLSATITSAVYVYFVSKEMISRTTIGEKLHISMKLVKEYITYNHKKILMIFFIVLSIVLGAGLAILDDPSIAMCISIDSLYAHMGIQIFLVTLTITSMAKLVYPEKVYRTGVSFSRVTTYVTFLAIALIALLHIIHHFLIGVHNLSPLCTSDIGCCIFSANVIHFLLAVYVLFMYSLVILATLNYMLGTNIENLVFYNAAAILFVLYIFFEELHIVQVNVFIGMVLLAAALTDLLKSKIATK
ncbi:hypothetical protein J4526_04040 [Desulfurococcaceae archaeon MEX13E-LK6-19]|nr:hypothetical protein J4526_04040 [Desulfurococcaceae archaeon MEX13E-LK6-19]